MTTEQAPAPARPKPPPANLRAARGLVFFRLKPYPLGPVPGGLRDGHVLARMRDGPDPPPYGAEAWRVAGGRWSEDFGGRRLERGTGQKFWEWTG